MISDPLLFFIVSSIGFIGGVILAARQTKESVHFGENTRRRMQARINAEANAAPTACSEGAPAA